MDLLFVMDPLRSVHPDKDSTFDLMVAAEKRGHRVHWCEQSAVRMQDGRVLARVQEVTLRPELAGSPGTPTPEQPAFFDTLREREVVLSELGAVFMRKDPPIDLAFMQATLLLWLAVEHGARVYNRPDSLLLANEKLYALRFPLWTPETLVTASLDHARAFAEKHGQIVVKPIDGNGGRAVFVLKKGDSNLAPVMETLTDEGRRQVIVQRYLPEVTAGDKRIVLVDGEPKGAINRIPAGGEHRANMHAGGTAVAATLSEHDKALCESLKPALQGDGLLFVGIDVIGGFLTEVNVTSPTGIQEIRRLCGVDIAPEVIAKIEDRA